MELRQRISESYIGKLSLTMYTVLTIDPPSLLLLKSEELKKIIMQKDGRINDEIKIARDPGHTEQGHCPEERLFSRTCPTLQHIHTVRYGLRSLMNYLYVQRVEYNDGGDGRLLQNA